MTSTEQGEVVLGLVVVNYASSALLEANLGREAFDHTQVVVVDNFSSALERERVRHLCELRGWTLVEQPDNRGFGAGANAGAVASRDLGCRSVLLVNPDLDVSPAVVEALRLETVQDPWAVVAPRLVDPHGRTVFEGHSLNLVDGRIRNAATVAAAPDPAAEPLVWLTAACLAVPLDLWERVSGFAEDYFMYWEDVDFTHRCLAAGARVVLRSDLVATHDQGGTQGVRRGRAKSALYYRYNTRNRMVFAVRHLDRRRVLRWLAATPRVGYEIWLHGGRRQLWEAPAGAVAALGGTAAALVVGARGLRTASR